MTDRNDFRCGAHEPGTADEIVAGWQEFEIHFPKRFTRF